MRDAEAVLISIQVLSRQGGSVVATVNQIVAFELRDGERISVLEA